MRIGELAHGGGVTPKTIRFYEARGLLPAPARTSSGYREYENSDLDRLRFIKTAQRLGFSLDEIREILSFRDRAERPCNFVLSALDRRLADIDRTIAELTDVRSNLADLKSRADRLPPDDSCYCHVIQHARFPVSP